MCISYVYTAVYRLITAYANSVDIQCKTHARIMNVNVKCLIFIIQYRGKQKEIRLPFLVQYQEVVTSESAHSASRTLRDAKELVSPYLSRSCMNFSRLRGVELLF